MKEGEEKGRTGGERNRDDWSGRKEKKEDMKTCKKEARIKYKNKPPSPK